MSFLGKVYAHEKDENFDSFVDTLGLPEDKASHLKNYKPNHKLEKNGDTYSMSTFSDGRNNVVEFKLGVEFDQNVVDGHTSKTTFTLDGNTLTQVQNFGDGKVLTTKRVFSDDKLTVTVTRTGWDGTAVRHFKA